jgi:hypothetical protein
MQVVDQVTVKMEIAEGDAASDREESAENDHPQKDVAPKDETEIAKPSSTENASDSEEPEGTFTQRLHEFIFQRQSLLFQMLPMAQRFFLLVQETIEKFAQPKKLKQFGISHHLMSSGKFSENPELLEM